MQKLTLHLPGVADVDPETKRWSNSAAQLFYSALAAGRRHRFWAALTRRSNELHSLEGDHLCGKGGHYAGLRQVKLVDIRGTEGRTKDFDDRFYPLSERTRQRWQSIANALAAGQGLPPVELTQVGSEYYVRDGHHRISVARTLGQQEVDAEVFVWTSSPEYC